MRTSVGYWYLMLGGCLTPIVRRSRNDSRAEPQTIYSHVCVCVCVCVCVFRCQMVETSVLVRLSRYTGWVGVFRCDEFLELRAHTLAPRAYTVNVNGARRVRCAVPGRCVLHPVCASMRECMRTAWCRNDARLCKLRDPPLKYKRTHTCERLSLT